MYLKKTSVLPSRSSIVLLLHLSILIYLELIFICDTIEIAFHVPMQVYTSPSHIHCLVCLLPHWSAVLCLKDELSKCGVAYFCASYDLFASM